MAIWQFGCVFVPRVSWERATIPVARAFYEGTRAYWSAIGVETVLSELRSLGEARLTWDTEVRGWGEEDKTWLELTLSGDEIDELRLRVDMREPDNRIVLSVLRAARKLGWFVLTETHAVIEPAFQWLLNEALNSSAGAFCADPKAFLDRLAKELGETE